jgi:hypothetical protein
MNSTASIQIRTADWDDFTALWSLATLDDSLVPEGPLLLAERDGAVVAALSLTTGESVADPFQRTADTVELLRLRAAQLPPAPERPRRRLLGRLRGRLAPVARAA